MKSGKEARAELPYYRRNLIVLWITTFLASASWTQVVPFLPLYLQELGVAENLAQWSGLVVSMQFAGGLVMAPIWGKIADQRGRKLMTIRAGLCLSAIYFLTGLATAPWHVAVLRFLNGALTGFIPSSMSLVATNTPQHLAARYVALLQTASAAGSVAGPVIGGVLASLAGIRGALFLSAANVLLSVILVIVLVEERNKVAPEKKSTLLEDFSTALHNPALVRVMGITILAMIGTVSIQPILTVYVGELAADPSRATAIAGVVYALPGIALVLTANAWVRIGQRRGYDAAVLWALAGGGALGVALGLVRSLPLFAVLFFLQGACLAGLRPVTGAIISEQIDEEFRGRAFGMQQAANTVGGLLGPALAGFVSARLGNAAAFWATGLVLLAGGAYLHIHERKVSLEERSISA